MVSTCGVWFETSFASWETGLGAGGKFVLAGVSVLVIGIRLGFRLYCKTHDKHVNANGEIVLKLPGSLRCLPVGGELY